MKAIIGLFLLICSTANCQVNLTDSLSHIPQIWVRNLMFRVSVDDDSNSLALKLLNADECRKKLYLDKDSTGSFKDDCRLAGAACFGDTCAIRYAAHDLKWTLKNDTLELEFHEYIQGDPSSELRFQNRARDYRDRYVIVFISQTELWLKVISKSLKSKTYTIEVYNSLSGFRKQAKHVLSEFLGLDNNEQHIMWK